MLQLHVCVAPPHRVHSPCQLLFWGNIFPPLSCPVRAQRELRVEHHTVERAQATNHNPLPRHPTFLQVQGWLPEIPACPLPQPAANVRTLPRHHLCRWQSHKLEIPQQRGKHAAQRVQTVIQTGGCHRWFVCTSAWKRHSLQAKTLDPSWIEGHGILFVCLF